MRRRTLLGGDSTNYVFSATTTSVTVTSESSSTSISIKSTADGENTPYVVYSYDGLVTAVTTAATSVTIRYSANTSLSSRSGKVVLKQSESGKIITITVTQSAATLSLNHEAIVLNAANSSTGYTTLTVTDSGTVTSKPSWANVTYSNGRINVTASAANSATTARTGTTTINVSGNSKTVTIIQMPNSYSSTDGHQYVTINGLKWAIKGVGATSITDYGKYYGYGKGATDGYKIPGYSGTENPLASSADTATQVMGGGWRMPTNAELKLLDRYYYSNMKRYWSSYNGITGIAFYDSNTNNCLFFPAAGGWTYGIFRERGERVYVWSSTPVSIGRAKIITCFYELDREYCYYSWSESGTGNETTGTFSIRGVHD